MTIRGWLLAVAVVVGVGGTAQAQVPGAPTGVTVWVNNNSALVGFTPPADTGGSAIIRYNVTASPALGTPPATGQSSPIEVAGVVNGVTYTFTVTATNSSGTGPSSAPSAAATPQPSTAPADAPIALTLGPVTVSTYNPVTMTPLENSTNLYFTAMNNDSRPWTLQYTSWEEDVAAKPSWLFHFFKLFGLESVGQGQPISIPLAAGETRTVVFYTSKDLGCGGACNVSTSLVGTVQQTTLPFRFRLKEDTSKQGTLSITIIASDLVAQFFATKTAVISGKITAPDGKPIAGALVTASSFDSNGVATSVQNVGRSTRNIFHARTAADGTYRLDLVSKEDVLTTLGSRTLPYRSLDYFVTAEADGYSMA